MHLDAMLQLATDLAREAGDLAVRRIDTATATAKGTAGDVVTEVDRECERLIVDGIRARFPDHAVLGEETGRHGSATSAVRWLVDPLDGTNNSVMGVPYYGVCITACVDDAPVVAVVHDSPSRRTFAAAAGAGCTVDGEPIQTGAPGPLRAATVAWTQGYGIDPDDERRNVAFARLERATKRVTRSWAPSIDWGLLAQGRLGGLVAYRNEPWDLVGGVLIATEAGAAVARDAAGDWVVVAHPETLPDLLAATGVDPRRPPAGYRRRVSGAARVRPMTEDEFTRWQEAEAASYAQEMVESGMLPPEAARQRAEEQHAEYLPHGRATAGMHLLRVLDDAGTPVGVLWVGPHPRKPGAGFVYDVAIDEDRQGQGHGRGAMLAAEAIGREAGWSEIGLNVFGPNARARGLYESLGYLVVNTNMAKPLG